MRALLKLSASTLLLNLIMFLPACAKRSQDQVEPGITTATALRTNLGEPTHTYTPAARPQARLLEYPDGCNFQVERDVVVGVACVPAAHEVTLQYWRHHWIGDSQRYEALPDSANHHGQRRFQFASKQAGMAVIYDEAIDAVVQVVRYEKR